MEFGAVVSASDGDLTVDVFLTACSAALLAGALAFLTFLAFITVFFAAFHQPPSQYT